MKEVILDTLIDSAKLVPLLFITYLFMEYMEERLAGKTEQLLIKNNKAAVLIGSFIGVIPQCGFAAGAASLYAGGLISAGTLIAVFVSASDEMLPVMLSAAAPLKLILKLLSLKVIIALFAGFFADGAVFKKKVQPEDKNICENEHCHCEEDGIFLSALRHTLSVMLYIVFALFVLNTAVYLIGEDNLANLVITRPYIAEAVCSLIGLIPGCASSVILTTLFLENIIPAGALVAGLCVNSGVGILVLYRLNRPLKENLKITAYILSFGFAAGCLLELLGLTLI